VNNMTDAHRGHPDVLRQPVLGQPQLVEQFLEIDPRMHRGDASFSHDASSMIIDDFDLFRVLLKPHEADPPPVIDTDTVLPLAVTLQRFQPIGGR